MLKVKEIPVFFNASLLQHVQTSLPQQHVATWQIKPPELGR